MERLCKNGTVRISREDLKRIVAAIYPERNNIKDRVTKVVLWARSADPDLIDEEDGIITIKKV